MGRFPRHLAEGAPVHSSGRSVSPRIWGFRGPCYRGMIARFLLICGLLSLAASASAALATRVPSPRSSEPASTQRVTCAPSVQRLNRAVAPGVRLVKSSTAPGTCTTMIHVATRGPAGVLWGLDTSSGLWRSTNDMRTWTLAWKPRGYRAVEHVLQLRSGRVLLIVYKNSGQRFILRSTDSSGTRFASKPVFAFPFDASVDPVLASATAPRILSPDSWVEVGKTIYVGEYGSAPNPVYLWKSVNGARSFRVAATFTGVRHIHSVFRDPYGRHAIWVAIGDNGPQPRIGYSTDGGKTFIFVSRGSILSPARLAFSSLRRPSIGARILQMSPRDSFDGTGKPRLSRRYSRGSMVRSTTRFSIRILMSRFRMSEREGERRLHRRPTDSRNRIH